MEKNFSSYIFDPSGGKKHCEIFRSVLFCTCVFLLESRQKTIIKENNYYLLPALYKIVVNIP